MKPFAIYFPQFYPTPTNDRAWGKGFTDWALVAHANMHGRWSRRAPRRGFYDGSDVIVHLEQLQQMTDAGLGGLALYHYWFHTHQELAAFEQTLLHRHDVALPWYLIWATEGWSKRWLGDPSSIIELSSAPTREQIAAHADHLATCFDHSAYLRRDGRPVFVWYHLGHFARPAETLEQYREALARRGADASFGHFVKNPFDAALSPLVEFSYVFEPRLFFGMQRTGRGSRSKRAFDAVRSVLGEQLTAKLVILADRFQQSGTVYDAESFLSYLDSTERSAFLKTIPGEIQEVVSPGWNNTPRYGERSTSLADLPPEHFGRLVHRACASSRSVPPLINAWNEWSEGAAIEPCEYLGNRYLDALKPPLLASWSSQTIGMPDVAPLRGST